jgi:hypothetical protein
MIYSASTRTPLLFSRAVLRTGSDEIPGAYCSKRHVWIHEGAPLVLAKSALAELQTKTDSLQERDDDSQKSFAAELETKTKAQVEHEDQDFNLGLLELGTKTASQIERDD